MGNFVYVIMEYTTIEFEEVNSISSIWATEKGANQHKLKLEEEAEQYEHMPTYEITRMSVNVI